MIKVNIYNKETNELIQTIENVITYTQFQIIAQSGKGKSTRLIGQDERVEEYKEEEVTNE